MEDEERRRTYGIWGVIVTFVVLAVVGGILLLVIGTPSSDTTRLDTPQTLPQNAGDTGTGVTMPDGSAAPEGVSEVVVDDGASAYSFSLSEDLDPSTTDTVVAPTEVDSIGDGAGLRIRVSCARSDEEELGQIGVTETEQSVTVIAVALVRDGAPECSDDPETVEVEVPLLDPLGSRAIIVVPAGTEVPDLAQS